MVSGFFHFQFVVKDFLPVPLSVITPFYFQHNGYRMIFKDDEKKPLLRLHFTKLTYFEKRINEKLVMTTWYPDNNIC